MWFQRTWEGIYLRAKVFRAEMLEQLWVGNLKASIEELYMGQALIPPLGAVLTDLESSMNTLECRLDVQRTFDFDESAKARDAN
jgi:hypothetical protein